MSELVAAEIRVSLVITDEDGDNSERVDTSVSGDPRLAQALGMLRMAEQSFIDGDLVGDGNE